MSRLGTFVEREDMAQNEVQMAQLLAEVSSFGRSSLVLGQRERL